MRIGFIGLGNVGGKLAGRLLRNGVDLSVHHLNAAHVARFVALGAKSSSTPLTIIRPCDAVIPTGRAAPAAKPAMAGE
ncbi:NAD(P)-binding domain-containing protein [Thioclava indica]|uniref:6-phosphogluconate dehydrogenase NADP-binding domain-containing protein n=1 Tax=Thioclava indica TaxID=1353528 RepID=A0A074JWP9_9RHOB|nr:hypothetical protein DT23_13385 [Thioclava indica]